MRVSSTLLGKQLLMATIHSIFATVQTQATTYNYPETSVSNCFALLVGWACKVFDTSLLSVSNTFCVAHTGS